MEDAAKACKYSPNTSYSPDEDCDVPGQRPYGFGPKRPASKQQHGDRASHVAGTDPHGGLKRITIQERASDTKLERQRMSWINRVFQVAGSLAAAATLLGYGFGLGWYSLVPGLLAFLAAGVLVPFFLVVRDERLALKRRQNQG